MDAQRIAGFVLVAVGAILLMVGINATGSIADQVSNTITGRFTQATMWYIIGGAASAFLGLLLVFVRVNSR